MDRLAYNGNILLVGFALQMLSSIPQNLNRVVFRPQRQRFQIESRRARRGQCRREKLRLRFWHQPKKRRAERQQLKQMSECSVQSRRVPRPVIPPTTQRDLIRFHRLAPPQPPRPQRRQRPKRLIRTRQRTDCRRNRDFLFDFVRQLFEPPLVDAHPAAFWDALGPRFNLDG